MKGPDADEGQPNGGLGSCVTCPTGHHHRGCGTGLCPKVIRVRAVCGLFPHFLKGDPGGYHKVWWPFFWFPFIFGRTFSLGGVRARRLTLGGGKSAFGWVCAKGSVNTPPPSASFVQLCYPSACCCSWDASIPTGC